MGFEKYYFDTNIWLDLYEKRGYANEVATFLFQKIILSNSLIYFSDLIVKELKHVGYSQYEILKIFSIAKPNSLKKVCIAKHQINEARKIAKHVRVPSADALHAVLA